MAIKKYTTDGAVLTGAPTIQGLAVPALTTRVINAATAANSTAAAAVLNVYLVPLNGAPDNTNIMIPARVLAPGESYPCGEIVNQAVGAGGSVQAQGAGITFKYTATDFV